VRPTASRSRHRPTATATIAFVCAVHGSQVGRALLLEDELVLRPLKLDFERSVSQRRGGDRVTIVCERCQKAGDRRSLLIRADLLESQLRQMEAAGLRRVERTF